MDRIKNDDLTEITEELSGMEAPVPPKDPEVQPEEDQAVETTDGEEVTLEGEKKVD